MDAPNGFRPLFRTSPVLELIGPLYCRGEGADLVVGLRVQARHCNARGTVHGGKRGKRLAFANCYISSNQERIVRASAVFLVAGGLDANA